MYFNTSHVTVYQRAETQYLVTFVFQYISCYCLSPSMSSVLIPFLISIHLMLLFISIGFTKQILNRHFNTSHVTVYRSQAKRHSDNNQYFNTSHVTVYRRKMQSTENIPMSFQYISCYCLSNSNNNRCSKHLISIHLMLLFIGRSIGVKIRATVFQYISCYCLSFLLPLQDYFDIRFQYISCYCLSPTASFCSASFSYFNTSHVTVYPFGASSGVSVFSFQYISCYCLSNTNGKDAKIIRKFQYISCYCLSIRLYSASMLRRYFNTSHVTVYLLRKDSYVV